MPESAPVPPDVTASTESISKECEYTANDQMSSSNQGFREEEDSPVDIGQVLGRARALVDCTPSPYDKDGLAFKKGDIIDILAKSSSGYWVGRHKNQIGHFKFINVEEIQNGERKNLQRRMSSFEQRFNGSSKTLEDLLEYLGLESYLNVLVLNGYHNLEALKGVEEQDLVALGVANSDHRLKLLNAIDRLEEQPDFAEGKGSPLHRSKLNQTSTFQPKHEAFNSPRKRSDSFTNNLLEPYVPCLSNNTDLFSVTSFKPNEINNLDHGLTRCNGTPLKEEDSRDILNIPPNRPPDKLYFYSDLQSNQKIHYSYSRGFSAYSEQLYFTRAGLVIDSPSKNHLLSQMNYLEKLSDLTVGGSTFNHLNGAVYPNSGSYITKEEKYLMESSRRKLKDKIQSYGREVNLDQLRDDSEFNGYLRSSDDCPESSYCNSYSIADTTQNNGKSLTLPRKKKGYLNNDLIFKSAVANVYRSDRKGKKSRRRKESSQPLLQCPVQPYTLGDFVAKKLQEEQIDLCEEPYTDKTGFCGIPPALVQRYADELQQDIYDVAEALDRERVHALQLRGRPAVPNDFLADSCCEPVVEANYNNLSSWLISLGLPIYEKLFQKHGCTELYHMASLKDSDLHRFGIENSKHIRLLKTAIEALHIHIEHCQYIS